MKPVRCSWVDMQKLRASLSGGERGDQKALTQMRCVDKRTVNDWKAAADVMDAMGGKVCLSRLSTFQPTHARLLARHLRKTVGKDRAAWDADEISEWVERVESEKLTVEQFKAALVAERTTSPGDSGESTCVVSDLSKLVEQGNTYGTIYADPPWAYSNQATRASTGNHYSTMSVDEIAALPVGELAAEQSHLWLWTTNAFLFECPRLFAAWGFEFKSSYVWVKPQMGIGNYLRNSHELLLLAVRGGLVGAARNVMSWGEFPRTAHSAKPEDVRSSVVERVSPGPRLELFGRSVVEGWHVWGNQVSRYNLFTHNAPEVGS